MSQSKEAKAAYMRASRAANPEMHRARSNAFTARHSERLKAQRNARYAVHKASIRAARHNTTVEALRAMEIAQGGACGICVKPLAPWPCPATHIDHCHDTGRVRGLLCRSCNSKEGWLRKHRVRLAVYLSRPVP